MVAFAFLGNTLFLTILVSMLSNTFSTIVANATAEIQFRRAVLTLEGVKSDAVFAYQPPFNILAVFLLLPLKFVVSPRWFHKIHVASVRLVNLPVLLVIAIAERRILWPRETKTKAIQHGERSFFREAINWLRGTWRITTHNEITDVFDIPLPESVEHEIAVDDELTRHLVRRQFTRHNTNDSIQKPASRRDSTFPGVSQKLRGSFSDTGEIHDVGSRLDALEQTTARIEILLAKLCANSDSGDVTPGLMEESTYTAGSS
jgi:hypothetical protein